MTATALPQKTQHRITRVEQNAAGELQGLLGAGHDDNLAGIAAHPAGGRQTGGDRLPERPVPGGVVVPHQPRRRPAPALRQVPRPLGLRERVQIRKAYGKALALARSGAEGG